MSDWPTQLRASESAYRFELREILRGAANHIEKLEAEEQAALDEAIAVSGIWLRRIGDYTEVLAEVDGDWRLVISERWDGNYSHIVEPRGIKKAPVKDKQP